MDKGGYSQPSTQDMGQEFAKADLDKWSTANRDIWKLVRITGSSIAQAKDIVIGRWDSSEKTRFEAWVHFFESEDDKKYKGASHIDCDLETVRTAALKIANTLDGERSSLFSNRLLVTDNAHTVIDYIRAMKAEVSLSKTAADSDERSTRMFGIIREVQDELSKKKLVRNLARVLAMDMDGMFPEVPQALAKLIESYGYATTRIQDVMGRLGLQLSMAHKDTDSDSEDDKLSKSIPTPKEVRKDTTVKAIEPEPVGMTQKKEPTREKHAPREEDDDEVMLPRVENRGA